MAIYQGLYGGANKNRTCDLILIRAFVQFGPVRSRAASCGLIWCLVLASVAPCGPVLHSSRTFRGPGGVPPLGADRGSPSSTW